MNERIKRLRARSLRAVPALSSERGRLLTRYYQSGAADGLSVPRQRAGAFAWLLAHKKVVILPDELIVGERGPAAKATPSYPEITCHSLARPGRPRPAPEDPLPRQRRHAPRLRRRDHPLLAGQDHARATLRPHDPGVARRLPGGRLHRVHGAARPRPHRVRRKDLRQGAAATCRPRSAPAWAPSISSATRRRWPGRRSCWPWTTAAGGHDRLRRPSRRPGAAAGRQGKERGRAKRSCCASPPSASGCRRRRRAISGRRCSTTGSSTWA